MRIGLLSDTHGYLDDRIEAYLDQVDEIWHAGDIGSEAVLNTLAKKKTLRAVYGNIDSHNIRIRTKEVEHFEVERVKVVMTHIAGSPQHLNSHVKTLILTHRPKLFVCGHSHILRVAPLAPNNACLYLNPGAAGVHGFHKTRTLLRFKLLSGNITELEAIELGTRGQLSLPK